MASTLPVLDTQRLRLTGATRNDLLALQQHWDEPLVRRYLFDDMPVDATLAARVLGQCLEAAPRGLGLWLATEKTSKAFLGCIALTPTSVAAEYEPQLAGLVEPMVSLAPGRWGEGFATEGLAAILAYAFETLSLSALAAVNDVPNAASERTLLNVGFSLQSEVDGPRCRLRIYRLERRAWLRRQDA